MVGSSDAQRKSSSYLEVLKRKQLIGPVGMITRLRLTAAVTVQITISQVPVCVVRARGGVRMSLRSRELRRHDVQVQLPAVHPIRHKIGMRDPLRVQVGRPLQLD